MSKECAEQLVEDTKKEDQENIDMFCAELGGGLINALCGIGEN
jgi:hypothetical protein